METLELTERSRMHVNESLYREFYQRYGAKAADLIIFYTQMTLYGDAFVRGWYPQSSYYSMRHTLVRDGYLDITVFRSLGGGRAYIT